MTTQIPELTEEHFERSLPRALRKRLIRGEISGGNDIVKLRTFIQLTQENFAKALGISVHTLRNWEQDRRHPEGPAIALLRIAARHPRVLLENLAESA
jgi:putative transcriptional regulator